MKQIVFVTCGLLFASIATFWQADLQAAVLVDQSPGTYGVLLQQDWSNILSSQYFAESVRFDSNVQLTGMDIYSGSSFGTVGQSVTIMIFNDDGGVPGSIAYQFERTIEIIDQESAGANSSSRRKFASFGPGVILDADTTYWVSMTGTTDEIAQRLLPQSANAGDGWVFGFHNQTDGALFAGGDMQFRLHGDVVATEATPEPATLAIWSGIGLVGLVGAYRRRKNAAA